jgi:hypothetical protein
MRGKTVVEELELRLSQMRDGTYTESDGAVLITRDASSGILTFSYPGLDNEDGEELLGEAARTFGYVREAANAPH